MISDRFIRILLLIFCCAQTSFSLYGQVSMPGKSVGRFLGPVPEIVFSNRSSALDFPIVDKHGMAAAILVDDNDYKGVKRASEDLVDDIERVTGIRPQAGRCGSRQPAVIIGTLGNSSMIDSLVSCGKIDLDGLKGKWESFMISVLHDDCPVLVIAGSDKRGTIYGIYELSE